MASLQKASLNIWVNSLPRAISLSRVQLLLSCCSSRPLLLLLLLLLFSPFLLILYIHALGVGVDHKDFVNLVLFPVLFHSALFLFIISSVLVKGEIRFSRHFYAVWKSSKFRCISILYYFTRWKWYGLGFYNINFGPFIHRSC